MTKLLKKAIAEPQTLSDDEQNAMAQWILEELESEKKWDEAFASSLPQLKTLADKALVDYREGRTQELNPDELE